MRFVLGMALTAGVLGLAACGGVDESLVEDPLYQLGYNDGCTSAHTTTTFSKPTRNKAYAGKSKAYDSGWSSGFSGCGGNPDAVRRGTGSDDDIYGGRER